MDLTAIMQTVIGIGLGVFLASVLFEISKYLAGEVSERLRNRKIRKMFSASQNGYDKKGLGLEEINRAKRFDAVVDDVPAGMKDTKRW